MPNDVLLSRIGAMRGIGLAVRDRGGPRLVDPLTIDTQPVALAPARSVAAAVALRPAVARDARIFARPRLDTARIVNPKLFDRLRPIRFPPISIALPGCPAGGEHDQGPSGNYTLPVNRAGAEGQSNWRWCRKCQGLAFGGSAGGVCVKGGPHDFTQSGDYVLHFGATVAGHQSNWRWCSKCQGLSYGGAPGVCPAGGTHDHTGSYDYALAANMPEAEGQPNWRWCAKCQSLAYAGGPVGASREELALPVAAGDPITDDGVFEAATGPERYYLPRYRLARRVVSGSEQYRIAMAAGEDGVWMLEVVLDRVRPDGLSADTLELEHEVLLQLVYRLTMSDGAAITKTLDFTEVGEVEDGSAIVARLRFASPAERDQALAAITTSGAGCGLIATRSVRVAAPIAGSPDRYRPVTRGLRQAIEPDPLYLNAAMHPYLAGGVRPAGDGGGPGLVKRQLQFGSHFHSYWIDATDPAHVYYLPDAFRLARREKPGPLLPLMTVRLTPGATPDADPLMAFEFVATPWLDTDRLEAATRDLAKGLPTPDPASIRLEPLPAEKASFWLALPGAGGGGLVERPAAQVDVGTAVIVSETLPMADFQQVYDALIGGAVAIMKGEIRIELRPGAVERVPFDGRFDRMNGDLFDAVITPGATPGAFGIVLTNAIESPLDVTTLTASLLSGGVESPATVTIDTPPPHRLAAGETLNLMVASTTAWPEPLPPGATIEPLLDFSNVRVVPDSEAIWAAIMDADTSAEAGRTVRVKLFAGMFDAPSGNEADRAMAIIVQFESGKSVELTPDKPEGEVRLSAPVGDIVLRRAGSRDYRYKTQIIRRTARPTDAEWRSDNADLLIPLLPAG